MLQYSTRPIEYSTLWQILEIRKDLACANVHIRGWWRPTIGAIRGCCRCRDQGDTGTKGTKGTRGPRGHWRFLKWGPVFEREPVAGGARGADGGWKRPPPPPPIATRPIDIERKLLQSRRLQLSLNLLSYVLIRPLIAIPPTYPPGGHRAPAHRIGWERQYK